MAVTITTVNPTKLLADIKAAIADESIRTWSVDEDGDFTHNTDQWRYRAWLRPRIKQESLKLYILAPKATTISKAVYAIYHGRFIESVLTHFDTTVTQLSASSLAEIGDVITSS